MTGDAEDVGCTLQDCMSSEGKFTYYHTTEQTNKLTNRQSLKHIVPLDTGTSLDIKRYYVIALYIVNIFLLFWFCTCLHTGCLSE